MKSFNTHSAALRNLQIYPRFPKTPRVVIFGAPNSGTQMFAHRLAIDLGVPAISLRSIYKNLLTHENEYRSETFYRKVIDLIKNFHYSSPDDINKINKEMEDNMIPEKLLTLTKYSEMGYVLTDYPRTIKQCEKYCYIFEI
jgi:adenylate kinase family enzyme